MTTGARGEQIVNLGDDQEVRLLFTNRAISEAETATGKSVIALSRGYEDGSSGVTEMAELIRAGMEGARRDQGGGRRPYTINDAFKVLDAIGFEAAALVVMEGIAAVLSYSQDDDDSANP